MRLPLAVTALLLLQSFAARAEMPDYDVSAHCKEIAAFGGPPSEMILNGCLKQEQAAYDALKPTWDQLPASIRAHCDEIARFAGPGSFMLLKGCVDQELDAARQNREFQFKR